MPSEPASKRQEIIGFDDFPTDWISEGFAA